MKITIIILNYNGKKHTLECLDSVYKVKKLKAYKVEIIVVDNGSDDGSVKAVAAKFPQAKLINNKENLGFAEGNNVGIDYALKSGADFIMLLNNDTLVDKDFLIELIKGFRNNKDIGVASPKIYFAPGFEFHKDKYSKTERGKVIWYAGGLLDWLNILGSHRGVDEVDKGQYQKAIETDFCTGCCMLIKKQVFEKIGLFDKKYYLYWEDVDFCIRAKKAGFKVFYLPQAFMWHKNAAASEGVGGKTSVYYQTRNRALFALKYAKIKPKLAVLKEMIGNLKSNNPDIKRAARDFYLLKFGKLIK